MSEEPLQCSSGHRLAVRLAWPGRRTYRLFLGKGSTCPNHCGPRRSRMVSTVETILEGKSRVELANQLYHNIVWLMLLAFELGIPEISRFWKTSFAAPLFAIAHHNLTFSNGGDRPKLTSLWCTHSFLSSLAILCDNKHVHKSWRPFVKSANGKKRLAFGASDEARYPDLLCERIISNLADYCKEQGALEPSDLLEQRFVADVPLDRRTSGALCALKSNPSSRSLKTTSVWSQHSPQLHAILENLPKGSRITLDA